MRQGKPLIRMTCFYFKEESANYCIKSRISFDKSVPYPSRKYQRHENKDQAM
jgi:hypothetical protein